MDDDVDIAHIHRYEDKIEKLVRLHRNHDPCIEWEAERLKSHYKQSVLAKEVPISGSLAP